MTTIRWQVRRVSPDQWEGEIEFSTGLAGERVAVRRRASSPGEAIEGAVCGADDLCGVLEESGIDIGGILSTVLDTASSVVRSVGGRSGRGERPSPAETRLPGPLASLASVAAMRPGAPGYGYGAPPGYGAPWGAPPGFPGAGFPGAPPGYGAPGAWGKPGGWPA